MKNLIFFLLGLGVGAGGTFVWLHKDFKKEIEEIRKDSEMPFTVAETAPGAQEDKNDKTYQEDRKEASDGPVNARNEAKIAYHKVIEATNGTTTSINGVTFANNVSSVPTAPPVPVMPREGSDPMTYPDPNAIVVKDCIEIDKDEFIHNNEYSKENLYWYRGDHRMATEDGTLVDNPFMLVGPDWEKYVGNYAQSTAFVRNPRLNIDYEIYVDEGRYLDEYGSYDEYGGDT